MKNSWTVTILQTGSDVPQFCYGGSHFDDFIKLLKTKEQIFWRFVSYQTNSFDILNRRPQIADYILQRNNKQHSFVFSPFRM